MTMATEAKFEHGAQLKIDYTPGSAVVGGKIIDLGGGLVGVANRAIAANELDALDIGGGVYSVKKAAGTGVTFAVGAEVYWDTVALTAVVAPSANTVPFGVCCLAAVTGDDRVRAVLNIHANLLDLAALGTVEASKIVVVDANKDIGDFRNLDCVNLDAGSSGVAGTVDVFPATASKGKFTTQVADQTGNTTVTQQIGEMGQATVVNLADPGAAAAYYALSTLQLTLAEMDVLDGATPGTAVASKAVVLNAAGHTSAVKTAALHIGASGAEVQVIATPAQLNLLAGASASIAAVLAGGLGGAASYVKTDNGTKTLVAAHATKDRACLVVVHIDEVFANGDTSQLILKIGETDTIEKCAPAATFTNAANDSTWVFAFTNTATKAILATLTAAAGTGTGACSITVIAIPTT